MKNKSFYSASLIFLIAFFLIFIRCDKDDPPPTGPANTTSVEEHIFYVSESLGGKVKIFSVEQGSFFDSVDFTGVPDDKAILYLHVIGDNEKLLASTRVGTHILDLSTGESENLTGYTDLIISPDSKYLFGLNHSTNRWELRSFDTQTLFHIDTVSTFFPRFSNDSKSLAYQHSVQEQGYSVLRVVLYDIEGDTLYTGPKYYNNLELTSFYPYPVISKNKVFFGGSTWAGFYSFALDIGSDTARVLATLPYQTTTISRVSPDDKYLFSVITPSWNEWPETILVFDTDTEQLITEISTSSIHQAGPFSISFDGKYLLTRAFDSHEPAFSKLGLFDAVKYEFIDGYEFGSMPGCVATKGN